MPAHSTSRTLPYSCEQLFDLAADVESYQEYLPGWVSARTLERTGNRLRVEQQLGLKPPLCLLSQQRFLIVRKRSASIPMTDRFASCR